MPFFIVFLVFIIWLILANIRVVAQAHCYVIERLGQYQSTWQAGIHVKIPVIDRIVMKISLKEQVLDFPPQAVITKDNVTMNIDSVVYAKVFDARQYAYGVENPMIGLQNLTATTLRSIIGEMELDATLSSREQINAKMQRILDEATDKWGLKVTRVEIKNIKPPKEIEEVMTKQMRAERERRQTVLEAQAHQEAVVSRAEGDKKAAILAAEAERDAAITKAEGQSKSIRMVYEAQAEGLHKLSESGFSNNVLQLKALEALKDVADGQATKIFIPNDLHTTLASLGVVGESLGVSGSVKSGIPREQMRQNAVNTAARAKVQADPCLRQGTTQETHNAAMTNAKMQYTQNNKTLK